MYNWKKARLRELIDIKHGFAFSGEYFSSNGPGDILMTPGNFAIGGGFQWGKRKYYSGPVPEEYVLQSGDLVVTMTDLSKEADTLGYSAVVPSCDERLLHNQRIGKVVTRTDDVDLQFLYWVMRSKAYREEVLASATGSTVKHTSPTKILAFQLVLPSLHEQIAIASVLGALEDKIDGNRRINETLEAMARAIFMNWFLQRSDGLTRSRVSDLITSGIMKIGDGYRAKNDEMGSPGLPFIRARELNNGFDTHEAEVLNERSVLAARDKVSRIGDVAFTSKGTIGRFARVAAQTPQFVYSPQVCFWRSVDPARLRPAILYLWMVSDDLIGQIDAVAGQTDMAPYVSLRDQRAMKMPVFGEDQHAVADMVEPLFALQDANLAEMRVLAATRDLLLPKLMSGEVRVRDVERVAEAAL